MFAEQSLAKIAAVSGFFLVKIKKYLRLRCWRLLNLFSHY